MGTFHQRRFLILSVFECFARAGTLAPTHLERFSLHLAIPVEYRQVYPEPMVGKLDSGQGDSVQYPVCA